jgi:hypothetical protein
MLPHRLTVVRTPLRTFSLQASQYSTFVKPLRKMGFKPHQTVLVFRLGHMRPLGAYRFVHADGRRLFLYFSKVRPFRFVIRHNQQRYASPFYETLAELQKELSRRLKMESFSTAMTIVPTWPLRPPTA